MADSGAVPVKRSVFIISHNEFVGRDAEDIAADLLPESEILLFSHPDEAISTLRILPESTTPLVVVVAPRWKLGSTPLAEEIGRRDGVLVILNAVPQEDAIGECRVVEGQMPFSANSLEAVLRQAIS